MVFQVTDHGKKKKLHREQDIDDSKDVISSLPNCVLSHILSFLPTKDAVGTCILSTRWQDLWTSLPNIDFDDRLVYFRSMYLNEKLVNSSEYAPFHNFVERVLVHRDMLNITRFRLSCRIWCEIRVSLWISSAILRNVKELELFFELQKQFYLPACVFNSPYLMTLKICMECEMKLPENVFLPNLKILHLGAIAFSDEESLNRLLLGCPCLEELKLIDCSWGNLEGITISIPTLKRLRIDEVFHLERVLPPKKRSDCIIKIQLPNLATFEYLGGLVNGIVLENQLSQLTDATVFVLESHGSKFDIAPDVFNLFSSLKHITALRVSSCTIKSLFVAEGFLGQLPVFNKLTSLDINVDIHENCPAALLKFLLGFPRLEVLAFHEGSVSDHLHRHDNVCSLIARPRCNLSRLKMINLCYLHGGSMGELYFLKDLVDIAPALEKVATCFCSNMDSSKKDDIVMKVQMLLSGSRGDLTLLVL